MTATPALCTLCIVAVSPSDFCGSSKRSPTLPPRRQWTIGCRRDYWRGCTKRKVFTLGGSRTTVLLLCVAAIPLFFQAVQCFLINSSRLSTSVHRGRWTSSFGGRQLQVVSCDREGERESGEKGFMYDVRASGRHPAFFQFLSHYHIHIPHTLNRWIRYNLSLLS